jgi:NAD(P)-dependent dehydrogenase (short-subunit alcohol dehydrogenase family)
MSNSAPVPIQGKVVLVTGANRGIGKAFVEAFLQQGAAKVYAGVRNLETAKSCFGGDTAEKEKVVPLYMDLTQPDSIQKACDAASDVDIVINNAGRLSRTVPLDANAIEQLQHEMDVNVYGLIRMAQAFLPILQAKSPQSPTAFVQINSVASFRCGIPSVATYSASKAAAYSITQALRQGCPDVRFVSVHPGPIATDMIANASEELAKTAEPPSQVADEVIAALASSSEQFHVFPDSKAKSLQTVLQDYTKIVIEDGKSYGV